jgi:hypothetical protein
MVAPDSKGFVLSGADATGRNRGSYTRAPDVFAVHDIHIGAIEGGAAIAGAQVATLHFLLTCGA